MPQMASETSASVNEGAQIQRPVVPEFIRLRRRNSRAWRDVADREEVALQQATNRAMMDPNIRQKDKILLRMRTDAERDSRNAQYACSAYVPSNITFPSGQVVEWQCMEAALGCFNTTIAMYIFDDRQQFPYVHAMDIENWLWRQWFRPYTTDIDLWRTFIKIFAVKYNIKGYKGSESRLDVDGLIGLHCNVCEQSERLRDVACFETSPDSLPLLNGPLRSLPWGQIHAREARDKYWRHTLLMQPLFRAVFMVLVDTRKPISPVPRDNIRRIADIQVQLILTGITEGLSAPILLEELQEYSIGYSPGDQVITTTLSIATQFILRLEQREIAAFGIQPNIYSLVSDISPPWILQYREDAKMLGWVEERDGSLNNLSPRSSEWVDRTLFPRWLGNGAIKTMHKTRDEFESTYQEPYTEDWWWNPEELPESATRNAERNYTEGSMVLIFFLRPNVNATIEARALLAVYNNMA
ncbi:hypothetical protein CHU98_g4893 [Xylaria longipes]|nr:hypothetical protein CHU98_g4893 [Xylaria longipes]